jgi:sigma54-dependent transcription regulator
VNDKVRDAHPEVPWRVITDMRNRVTHGYFDIDLDVVWNTVTRDLPKLKESVARIRAELDSEAENSRKSSPSHCSNDPAHAQPWNSRVDHC